MTDDDKINQPRVATFIAASMDGYIARPGGDLDWLIQRGEAAGDTGYERFMAELDAVLLGRNTYETARTFDLWPYGTRPVGALSTALGAADDPRVVVHRTLTGALSWLSELGARRVYADGGRTITALLAAGALHELIVTTIPVLLGSGIRLYGPLEADVPLIHRETTVLGAGLVQSRYELDHGPSVSS